MPISLADEETMVQANPFSCLALQRRCGGGPICHALRGSMDADLAGGNSIIGGALDASLLGQLTRLRAPLLG
jgi:hypothetical protein